MNLREQIAQKVDKILSDTYPQKNAAIDALVAKAERDIVGIIDGIGEQEIFAACLPPPSPPCSTAPVGEKPKRPYNKKASKDAASTSGGKQDSKVSTAPPDGNPVPKESVHGDGGSQDSKASTAPADENPVPKESVHGDGENQNSKVSEGAEDDNQAAKASANTDGGKQDSKVSAAPESGNQASNEDTNIDGGNQISIVTTSAADATKSQITDKFRPRGGQ
jgi:hypothetical protein